MRILNVIESLGGGGAEQVLVNVLPELQARGHACELAVLWPPYDLQGALEGAGVRVHRLGWGYGRRWSMAGAVSRLARLARRRRPDVLHAHLLFADLYVALSRPLLPGVARVMWGQNTDFDFLHGSLTARAARRLLPFALRHGFDGLAAVGTPVAQHYRQHVPGADVRTIFNAVPVPPLPPEQTSAQRQASLAEWKVRPEDFVLLIAARLAPEKNHRVLLEALVLLRERGRCPQVLVAGEGPLREELQRFVREKKLQGQVIFCGRLDHARLLEVLPAVDAFALPSQHEGLPLALAEAMAVERAVLATPVGGVPDLIQDNINGLLVPPGDAPALSRAIERLMDDEPLRRRLGRAAREQVTQHFSTQAVAAQWEAFYAELLHKRAQA